MPSTSVPTAATTPANSAPRIHGIGNGQRDVPARESRSLSVETAGPHLDQHLVGRGHRVVQLFPGAAPQALHTRRCLSAHGNADLARNLSLAVAHLGPSGRRLAARCCKVIEPRCRRTKPAFRKRPICASASTAVVTSPSGLPFDDIRALVASMPGAGPRRGRQVRARDAVLTKPAGSLGRLEEIAEWLAAWQGRAPPAVNRPLVAVFAGNHGVTARGVSAFPAAVTGRWSRTSRRRRRHQPDLPRLRSRPEGLRPRARAADRRHHRRGRARRVDLRRHHGLRHGRRRPAASIFSASARWASAIRRLPPRSSLALFGGAAAEWVGPGTGVDAAGIWREGRQPSPCRRASPAAPRRSRWKCSAASAAESRGDGRGCSPRA